MLADLHAHYPMHIVAQDDPRATIRRMRTARGRPRIRDKLRALLLAVLSRLINDRTWWSGFRVTAPLIHQGSARVVDDIARRDPAEIRLVRNRAELDRCIADGATAMVHCVEGGFHLGDEDAEIARNVRTLADKGVAYLTLAHLFFRQVATNAPALPFLPDWLYNVVFPQRRSEGLTGRGEAAVRAMVEHGVIVDISHMAPAAVEDTFRLL